MKTVEINLECGGIFDPVFFFLSIKVISFQPQPQCCKPTPFRPIWLLNHQTHSPGARIKWSPAVKNTATN